MELEKTLRTEQDRAADLVGKLTFYGNAYQKLQGKLTGVLYICLSSTVLDCNVWLCISCFRQWLKSASDSGDLTKGFGLCSF